MSTAIRFPLIVFLVLASSLSAQVAHQVIDIDPRLLAEQSSLPNQITAAGELTYFTATVPPGIGVWATDGSPGDARLLASFIVGEPFVEFHGRIGDRMLFSGQTTERLTQLWSSDGTHAGTVLLTTFQDSARGFGLSEGRFTVSADGLIFLAREDEDTTVVFVSDGTRAGTRDVLALPFFSQVSFAESGGQVAILAGGFGLWMADGMGENLRQVHEGFGLNQLTVALGRFFFSSDMFSAPRLWSSDGTEAGTLMVRQFESVATFSVLTTGDAGLYLRLAPPSTGQEIWRSDGTPEGTRQITELEHPFALDFSVGSAPAEELDGKLVFLARPLDEAGGQLFVTDGEPASTRALTDLDPGFLAENAPLTLVRVGDRVVARALIAESPSVYQLWVSDGTESGTQAISPSCSVFDCDSGQYAIVPGLDGWVFAQNMNQESAIWTTDGSASGTREVARFDRLPQESGPWLAVNGDTLYFSAADPTLGFELWRSEGAEASTRLVANLAGARPADSSPWPAALGDRVVFSACNDDDLQLYSTGGTENDTFLIADLDSASCGFSLSGALETQGHLVFLEHLSGDREQLWATSGQPGDLRNLTRFMNSVSVESNVLARVGDRVLFNVQPEFLGPSEIWETDGTVAGTRRSGLSSELGLTGFDSPVPVGDRLMMLIDEVTRREVWLTDGTVDGTQRLYGRDGFFGIGTLEAATLGGDYYFATDSDNDVFLWRSDGTTETPQPVFSAGGLIISEITKLRRLGDRLLFFGRGQNVAWGLWSTDGTEAGTQLLADVPTQSGFGVERQSDPVVFGDRLLFSIYDDIRGREPWISDGTVAGTGLLVEVEPGPASSDVGQLQAVGDRAYFVARDSVAGYELWTTDGTSGGTRRVEDIAAGPANAFPRRLEVAGSDLYFAADDGLSGLELWTVPSADQVGCTDGPNQLCLGDGRFQVTIDWEDFGGTTGRGQAVPLSDDTGAFWFFGPQNLEAMVKIIDGREANGHFWVFYGSLTNVAFTLEVLDTVTGRSAIYTNPLGEFASAGDIEAIPAGDEQAVLGLHRPVDLSEPALASYPPAEEKVGTCVADAQTLCLAGGRFRARVQWTDFVGATGGGNTAPLTEDTGAFWFFGAQNLELMVKIIDGRDFNERFWVFYGALTNVAFQLTVEDTVTGASVTYDNPLSNFASRGDIEALPGN